VVEGSDFESRHESPLGQLRLVASSEGLVGLYLPQHKGAPLLETRPLQGRGHAILEATSRQIEAYFKGQLEVFDLRLDLRGTAFQLEVWGALMKIPFGATWSYAELARVIGRSAAAARAVGAANALNPISIIVPCHRVIAGDGALTGYAGGIEAKRWLLAHEARRGSSVAESADKDAQLGFGFG
jgi:methylated-DNA-[protein]-cysteine S-methyltransferase